MITIGALSRQTGVSADTLRKWESRYGFPVPLRTSGGHRAYDPRDLDALVDIARRIAGGERAGAAIAAVRKQAPHISTEANSEVACVVPQLRQAVDLLLHSEIEGLQTLLDGVLLAQGIHRFSEDLAIPLISEVGRLWQIGELPMYAEHLFSTVLQMVVQRSIARTTLRADPVRVLLASPAGEQHSLALVLLNARLHASGLQPVFLQGGLPAPEIAAAATAYGTQVVALSASLASPPRLLGAELRSLRRLLPAHVEIWIGGAGTRRLSQHIEAIEVITAMDVAVQRLGQYRPAPPPSRTGTPV